MANNGGLEKLEGALRNVQNADNYGDLATYMNETTTALREMARFINAYADNLDTGMNNFDQQIRAMIGKIHGQVNKG